MKLENLLVECANLKKWKKLDFLDKWEKFVKVADKETMRVAIEHAPKQKNWSKEDYMDALKIILFTPNKHKAAFLNMANEFWHDKIKVAQIINDPSYYYPDAPNDL